ncbi:Cell adhesion molecule 3 [Collichthys lucidus]|uniref:Cell adhesion molecule 3 n=1 Tax=Collichthys lucidus TaxID=240159 RepID=A0A4U5UW21_COLLU|nr:Cell adhesion molecule 3 [Collichthys lucidus]
MIGNRGEEGGGGGLTEGRKERQISPHILLIAEEPLIDHREMFYQHKCHSEPQTRVAPDDDPLQPVTTDETVSVGGTVTLTCRVAESDNSSLQWSNTAQQTLYFGAKRALRDLRIQLHRSTHTELSITISDVQLSDEGDFLSVLERSRSVRVAVRFLLPIEAFSEKLLFVCVDASRRNDAERRSCRHTPRRVLTD